MAQGLINLHQFQRWKVDTLRDCCRERGFEVSGRWKDELVVLA